MDQRRRGEQASSSYTSAGLSGGGTGSYSAARGLAFIAHSTTGTRSDSMQDSPVRGHQRQTVNSRGGGEVRSAGSRRIPPIKATSVAMSKVSGST